MPRFARVAAVIVLVAALSSPVQASAGPLWTAVRLDPARMFNPIAESLLADLFALPKALSPVGVALFSAPNPAATAVASPVSSDSGGSSVVAAVNLHAYMAPLPLPSEPLEQPSVTPVAPVQRTHLAQPAARVPLHTSPTVRFGAYMPYVPALQSVSENVSVPVRVGGVHFSGIVTGAQAQSSRVDPVRAMQLCGTTDEAAACPYLHDERVQSLAAGTNFNVRAGNTRVNLQLSGSVGHVSNHDAAMYRYTPLDPDTQLDPGPPGAPGDSSLLYYPGLADVVRHGVDASLAVPVSPVLTVGLQYDRSHYQGNYATLLAPGLDARKDTYLGNVTYQLPHSSSLITLSARQYHYLDSFAPNFNLTQTRADLSFTVKF